MQLLDRKRKTKDPCAECGLHRSRCICEDIPRLSLQTKISLVVHVKELKRTTNTGRLVIKALVNSEMYVRGESRQVLDLSSLLEERYTTCIFFPSQDAIELSALKVEGPVQLIVPDGNWRQASKLCGRHKELSRIPRVFIGRVNPAQFHLRKETSDCGMSTLEAIAHAIQILEGEAAAAPLFALYQAKLRNTLLGRGVRI